MIADDVNAYILCTWLLNITCTPCPRIWH